VTFYCVIVCIRYDKAAGTWEARRKKETGEARKWDILDYTYQSRNVCSRSHFSGASVFYSSMEIDLKSIGTIASDFSNLVS
jgi:hypothetical protein